MGSLNFRFIHLIVSISTIFLVASNYFVSKNNNLNLYFAYLCTFILILNLVYALKNKEFKATSALILLVSNTSAIYLNGIENNFFSMLYFPIMMLSAMVLSRKIVLSLSAFTIVLYGSLAFFNTGKITLLFISNLLGLSSGLILVSISTLYLQSLNQKRTQQLNDNNEKLLNLIDEKASILKKLNSVEQLLSTHNNFEAAKNSILSGNVSDIGLVGESVVIKKVHDLIQRVAVTDATVLISGPSGTGKEVTAKAIHKLSCRGNGPFVVVNCGAIPEQLLESELFGHKKGAFTGAVTDSKGMFLEADGGTIFLDEIGELPLQMQAKLLRVIQEKTVRSVGSTKDVPIDIRILAATNRNLKEDVKNLKFREDLFYRLNVVSIVLPSLAERKEDIPLLVHAALKKILSGKPLPEIPADTLARIMDYDYPGNVRELENLLERAIVFDGNVLLPEHFPLKTLDYSTQLNDINQPKSVTNIFELNNTDISFPVDLEKILNDIEKAYIVKALDQSKGVKKKAAELLGINGRSFRYRYEKYYSDQN
jgi:transcriptional regulator with PAS, ATPase and Fis domain